MNDDGDCLVYADQRSAEQKAMERRNGHIDLVERLEELASRIDSLALYRLVEAEKRRIEDVNF